MKKILSLALVLVMVLSLSVTAFAATGSISGAGNTHTYQIYQIFTGDVLNKTLSTAVWGENAKVDAELIGTDEGVDAAMAELKEVNGGTNTAILKVVEKYVDLTSEPYATVSGAATVNVPTGYYLIKDVDGSLTGEGADAYTVYLAQVVGDVTITPKADKPTMDKKIQHNETGEWGVVGDNQIGDTVNFYIEVTVPYYTEDYTTYKFVVEDEMSAGLTSHVTAASDVTIRIGDVSSTNTLGTGYYIVSATGNKFTVNIDVKKAVAADAVEPGDKLFLCYSATLNENANIYADKEENKAQLTYSNNPKNGNDTAKTPEKKVYEWTFKMDLSKIDGEDVEKNVLNGAKFVLSKSGDLTTPTVDEDGNLSSKDGLIPLVKDTDGTYRVATANEVDAAGTNLVYIIDAGTTTIKGLDDHIGYYLYEVVAPAGYNLLKQPVKVVINATYSADGSVATPTLKVGEKAASDVMKAEVENKKGSAMPETGGIGTTIFYIVGTVLVMTAGVMLITKKRMNNI